MRCPFCGNTETQVKDSRPAEDHVAIRRRRFCPACGGRFTTYERVQLRDLTVVKKNGKREDFDRDKLSRSIRIALQKRPIEPERIEQMISGIVRRLESTGETDIASKEAVSPSDASSSCTTAHATPWKKTLRGQRPLKKE